MKRRRPTWNEALTALALVKLGQELGSDSGLARAIRAAIELALLLGRL